MKTPVRQQRNMTHTVQSATLPDVLERILDMGLMIAGDTKIVDIELLTIQIRLLVCSVDKAQEMGIDWWISSLYLNAMLMDQPFRTEDLIVCIARLEVSAININALPVAMSLTEGALSNELEFG